MKVIEDASQYFGVPRKCVPAALRSVCACDVAHVRAFRVVKRDAAAAGGAPAAVAAAVVPVAVGAASGRVAGDVISLIDEIDDADIMDIGFPIAPPVAAAATKVVAPARKPAPAASPAAAPKEREKYTKNSAPVFTKHAPAAASGTAAEAVKSPPAKAAQPSKWRPSPAAAVAAGGTHACLSAVTGLTESSLRRRGCGWRWQRSEPLFDANGRARSATGVLLSPRACERAGNEWRAPRCVRAARAATSASTASRSCARAPCLASIGTRRRRSSHFTAGAATSRALRGDGGRRCLSVRPAGCRKVTGSVSGKTSYLVCGPVLEDGRPLTEVRTPLCMCLQLRTRPRRGRSGRLRRRRGRRPLIRCVVCRV